MVDRVGQQLGNYRLLRLLGQGGQASVYLGEHLYLKSQAALKVRHTVLTEEEQTVFLQEAQTLVRLSHPHIVRVLDFALQDGMPLLVGTTPYLAPEQLRGKAQPASDQYALGVAIYEWLCGKPPFQGPFLEVAMQHVSAPPPSLREQVPDLSPAIEEVVLRALAKEPEQRFTRVQDFATALAYASQQAVSPRLTPVLAPEHGVETGHRPPFMHDLPRGTVTLLFTAMEGSTRLLQQL